MEEIMQINNNPNISSMLAHSNVIRANNTSSPLQNNAMRALDRRFDTFVNEASQNFIERLNSKIEDKLFSLMNMSPSDRRYFAFMYKENMKRLTNDAISHEERELEKFDNLQEQKAYYQGILDDNGYVNEGKFAFGGLHRTYVSKVEVQEFLDAVQGRIDDVVTARIAKESDPFDRKTWEYIYSGAASLAAADARGNPAIIVDDVSISGQWTRTEENFREEALESIKSLNTRLDNIDRMYNDFLRDNDFEERISNQDTDYKLKKVEFLMTMFESWNQKAMLKMMEFSNIDQDEVMMAFERLMA
jgi:hypothetical protein